MALESILNTSSPPPVAFSLKIISLSDTCGWITASSLTFVILKNSVLPLLNLTIPSSCEFSTIASSPNKRSSLAPDTYKLLAVSDVTLLLA